VTHPLVLATTNRSKVEELRGLLAGMGVRILTVDEVLRHPPNIIEDGRTFAENATKKARAIAQACMMLTLADDSGLEVDDLEGRPGVRSARFAHARATDAENNAALLSAIEALGDPTMGTAPESCPARFRCALAIVDPYGNDGEPVVVEGVCEGRITRSPRGATGFGYDPLFVVTGLDKTMAELTPEEKNSVSHRALACAALRPVLESLLKARDAETERIGGAT
jgi:XTP/dITP diphosphohydrolase